MNIKFNPEHTYGDYFLVTGHELEGLEEIISNTYKRQIGRFFNEADTPGINKKFIKAWMSFLPSSEGRLVYDDPNDNIHYSPVTVCTWKTVPCSPSNPRNK